MHSNRSKPEKDKEAVRRTKGGPKDFAKQSTTSAGHVEALSGGLLA